MKFTMSVPCDQCPFRKPLVFRGLYPDRIREIGGGMEQGDVFVCHKTTEAGGAKPGREVACAGALAVYYREHGHGNQLMRVAERLGLLDTDKLDIDGAPVWDTFEDCAVAYAEQAAQ